MTERDTRSGRTQDSPGATEQQRAQNAKSFLATAVCVLGLVTSVGAAIATLFVGVGVDIVSAGAISVGLGVLGYFLGAGRLATMTIIVCVVSLFLGLAANQVIPGIGGDDRELPASEPRSQE